MLLFLQLLLLLVAGDADWVKRLHEGQRLTLQTTVVRSVDNDCGGTIEAAPGWGDVVEAMGGNVTLSPAVLFDAEGKRAPSTLKVTDITVEVREPEASVVLLRGGVPQ